MSGRMHSEMAARMAAGRRARAEALECSLEASLDDSVEEERIVRRSKRAAAPSADHDISNGSEASVSDDSGHGAMRTTFDDDSALEAPARQRRRAASPSKYEHMTQAQADQAHLVAMAAQRRLLAPPQPAAAPAGECPICYERITPLYEEAQTSGAKARSAVQEKIINQHTLIFSTESALRGRMRDEELLPILLQLHQRLIEKPARENQLTHNVWTLADLQRHFDPRNPHIFDEVREIKNAQHLVRGAMHDVRPHVLEQDPNSPGSLMVCKAGVSALSNLAAQNAKLTSQLVRMQTAAEKSVSDAIFSLVSTVRRAANVNGLDQALLREPALAAGTMMTGETAVQSAVKDDKRGGVDMYKISGY